MAFLSRYRERLDGLKFLVRERAPVDLVLDITRFLLRVAWRLLRSFGLPNARSSNALHATAITRRSASGNSLSGMRFPLSSTRSSSASSRRRCTAPGAACRASRIASPYAPECQENRPARAQPGLPPVCRSGPIGSMARWGGLGRDGRYGKLSRFRPVTGQSQDRTIMISMSYYTSPRDAPPSITGQFPPAITSHPAA
jgi:hypothetical protein